jgi:hypothetical protein
MTYGECRRLFQHLWGAIVNPFIRWDIANGIGFEHGLERIILLARGGWTKVRQRGRG